MNYITSRTLARSCVLDSNYCKKRPQRPQVWSFFCPVASTNLSPDFATLHEKYFESWCPVAHKCAFHIDLYRSIGNSQRYLPVKYFAPKPPGSDARASQSQNAFFREIGICAEKCAQLIIPALDRKTVDILLKALQITFPTQKSDPKSVKRFPSYCPKTLPFLHKKCAGSPTKLPPVANVSVLLP